MITWMELPKVVDGEWLPKRAEALQALPSCKFNQRMKYGGMEYTTTLQVQFGCLIAYHHHLWSECRQKGCVACPWVNRHGAATLFLHKGGRLNDVRGSHKFEGVSNLAQVHIIQLVLHNTKGGASKLLGNIGRTVPGPYKHELLKVIAQVTRRYHLGTLPPDSRELHWQQQYGKLWVWCTHALALEIFTPAGTRFEFRSALQSHGRPTLDSLHLKWDPLTNTAL